MISIRGGKSAARPSDAGQLPSLFLIKYNLARALDDLAHNSWDAIIVRPAQSLNSQGIYCVLIKRNLLGPTTSISQFSRSFRPRYSKIGFWSFEPNGNFFRNLKMSFQTKTINFRQSSIANLNKLTLICNGNESLKQLGNTRTTTKTNYR